MTIVKECSENIKTDYVNLKIVHPMNVTDYMKIHVKIISERKKDVLKECRERIEHLEKELDKYMNNREIKNG